MLCCSLSYSTEDLLSDIYRGSIQVQEVQLKKEQELLNHQLQKAVLGRSLLNTKADIKSGVGHKARVVKQPVDTNAWHKILSKEIAKHRKVRSFVRSPRDLVTATKKKLSRCVPTVHVLKILFF